MRVMYDLDYSVRNLMKKIGEEVPLDSTKIRIGVYRINYVAGKLFSVKRAKAFVFFANASRYVTYPEDDLNLDSVILAERARDVGEHVYTILSELGINVTSLINPVRTYERQIKWLYQRRDVEEDPVVVGIVDKIGSEIYGEAWERHASGIPK